MEYIAGYIGGMLFCRLINPTSWLLTDRPNTVWGAVGVCTNQSCQFMSSCWTIQWLSKSHRSGDVHFTNLRRKLGLWSDSFHINATFSVNHSPSIIAIMMLCFTCRIQFPVVQFLFLVCCCLDKDISLHSLLDSVWTYICMIWSELLALHLSVVAGMVVILSHLLRAMVSQCFIA